MTKKNDRKFPEVMANKQDSLQWISAFLAVEIYTKKSTKTGVFYRHYLAATDYFACNIKSVRPQPPQDMKKVIAILLTQDRNYFLV